MYQKQTKKTKKPKQEHLKDCPNTVSTQHNVGQETSANLQSHTTGLATHEAQNTITIKTKNILQAPLIK
jgi:hypothetical protein